MAARSPRIVVTLAVPTRDPQPALAVRKNALYVDSVVRHGATAIPLDATATASARAGAFASMDGLLISGGTDLAPSLYGQAATESRSVEPDRDELELRAYEVAHRRGLPILGICRGLQAMNVFSGGGLVQNLDGHSGPGWGSGHAHTHPIRIVPGTRLARIVGIGSGPGAAPGGAARDHTLHVNSYHHQGVTGEHLAPGLVASAWADSPAGALVEALEAPEGPFRVAVQCHPERTESSPRELEQLFASFVAACREPLAGR
jgi:putative glutamine amidotransferase